MRPSARVLFAVLALFLVVPVLPAAASDPAPQWEAVSDTGMLGHDVARFTGASPTLNMVNQGLDTVFVTGTSGKPSALNSTPASDLDVGTTAYNANTGAVRWRTRYDRGLGIDDQIGAFEVNYHNNLIYEMVNSGNDLVTIERGVADGKVSRSAIITGANASDSGISSEGGFLGVAGNKGSDFYVLTYMTGGQVLEFEATPVKGRALSADISHTGSLNSIRTLLATGQSSGFGTGGDMYTVAYNYRTHAKLWERSWASPDNRADEGLVAEAAHVTALGKGVAFLAGRTYTPARGWDMIVTALDLATGAELWATPLTFDGQASKDDTPMYLTYSDKTSTLYLAGTSERGVPHGEDVVAMAIDATTGTVRATTYASGDSANADDSPTGLLVSKDGQRVFIAANIHNLLGTGERQAALFGYDSDLRPAGRRAVGAEGEDRSAGVAMNVAQDRVFLAGSTRTTVSGFDHRVSSFAVDGFVLPPKEVATSIAFTGDSASSGQFSDSATLRVRLTDASGRALANQTITFSIGGTTASSTTNTDGIATATFDLTGVPGGYTATADFAGAGTYLASGTSAPFEIAKEAVQLAFTPASATGGQYSDNATIEVVASDDDGTELSGRTVAVTLAGDAQDVSTGADGLARATFTLRALPGTQDLSAADAGDDYYTPASHTATFEVTREDSEMSLSVAGNGSKRTLSVSLYDMDTPQTGVAGRVVTFYADGNEIGTAATDAEGRAKISVPSGYRGGAHTFRAVFSGDNYFAGSEGQTQSS